MHFLNTNTRNTSTPKSREITFDISGRKKTDMDYRLVNRQEHLFRKVQQKLDDKITDLRFS